MTIVHGYATLAEAKTWVGINDTLDDGLLEQCVSVVSRWIDGYCRRHFWQTASTARQYDSCGGAQLDVDDLVSVSSLATDDDYSGTFETAWSAADYQLAPTANAGTGEARPYSCIRAVGARSFPQPYGYAGPYTTSGSRLGLVQVTGVWGWPAVPDPVRQACQMQSSRMLQRRKSPEGVAGWGEFGPLRISGRLDPDVAALLAPYRKLLVR